jgi:hypothetical protein
MPTTSDDMSTRHRSSRVSHFDDTDLRVTPEGSPQPRPPFHNAGDWFKSVVDGELTKREGQEEIEFLAALRTVLTDPTIRPTRSGAIPLELVDDTLTNLKRSLRRFQATRNAPPAVVPLIQAEIVVLRRLLDCIKEQWTLRP